MHKNSLHVLRVAVALLVCCLVAPSAMASPALELKQGDHVAVIGNTLADRMQHDGWLETYVYAKYPTSDLVWRNLAVAGDEVAWRHRSDNFGTPDEWLTKVKAGVVLAFFGFNESFKGEAGLPQFKQDLAKFITDTKAKQYDGKASARLVLFSPIAAERHQDANFLDPAGVNANLKLYTDAMAEVAKANNVPFVDLFTPSQKLFADAAAQKKSLTVNGLHLNEEGDKLLAGVIFESLFGEKAPASASQLDAVRKAVLDKGWQWHQRYRTVDGYNVYGGRSKLEFPSSQPGVKINNYTVMQEEMSQRDVLTANRDPAIWAAAQGKPYKIDDSNLPPVTEVPTNKTDASPYLGGEAAIARMKPHAGIKVNLFASEEQFPDLINPVQMAFDAKGRLWVAAWRNYPERTPTSTKGDSLLVLEDTDGDGKADKCTPFMDDLNCPTGFQFYKDGVLLMQAPDVWFVRDTNGDGKGDSVERVLMGLDSADSHHTTNSMCYEPGGAIYLSDGVFHRSQVETPNGLVRNDDAAIYRFEPRTGKFDRYAPYGFANPHGRVFDAWGNDLITDATGNNTYFGPAISGRIDYPQRHPGIEQFWKRPSRPSPGTHILTSKHFPEEFWGNFLNMNVISFQGIYRVKVKEEGSGLWGEQLPDFISSSDPNFRPTALATGPDGAVYMADWHQAIIGHMQHHLRDPLRGHSHGRVYRLTYEGRPLSTPPKIDGQPIEALLELLKAPENQVRELAKIELDKHDSQVVIAATKKWAAGLAKDDPEYAHRLTEALWVHQWHNAVDEELLKQVLALPEPRARAAGVRVLCYWRDRVSNTTTLLKQAACDDDARVRLQAVRAASFINADEAVDIALDAVRKPTDYYLNYVLSETLRQLQPRWSKALADGKPIAADNPDGVRYLLRSVSPTDLLKLSRTPGVLETIVTRAGILDADRQTALTELSTKLKKDEALTLLDIIERATKSADAPAASNAARLIPMMRADDAKTHRARLEALAMAQGTPAGFARYAWAGVAMGDGSFDNAWAQAARSPEDQSEVLYAVPLVFDTDLREKAKDKALPLLAPGAEGKLRGGAIAAAISMPNEHEAVAAALAKLLKTGQSIGPASRGLRALPEAKWAKTLGPGIAKDLVAWAKKVPAEKRTGAGYLDAIQLASDLATKLDGADVVALRNELKDLRVAAFSITAVREQMRYDTTTIVVEAGKPLEIIFENTDFMPHNLVVVKPGGRPAVGKAAMQMKPDQLDGRGRAFVPVMSEVLGSTKLLEAGEKATLSMTAPAEEGVYEYVCTYPGHWEVMWGRMIVTKDVDAYLKKGIPPAETPKTAASTDHKHHTGK